MSSDLLLNNTYFFLHFFRNLTIFFIFCLFVTTSDVEAEAEAPEAVDLW
jgi:hypothetical protein